MWHRLWARIDPAESHAGGGARFLLARGTEHLLLSMAVGSISYRLRIARRKTTDCRWEHCMRPYGTMPAPAIQ
jgi:hypothetical protein